MYNYNIARHTSRICPATTHIHTLSFIRSQNIATIPHQENERENIEVIAAFGVSYIIERYKDDRINMYEFIQFSQNYVHACRL